MILLSVDTSGPKGSLALIRGSGKAQEIRQVAWTKKAIHSEIATVQLVELLAECKTTLHEITHFAVNVGPGSFTGLRVGISLVKALAFSLVKPVATVNTLECLAFKNSRDGDVVFVATKAVQNFFYAATYENTAAGPIERQPPQAVEGVNLAKLSKGSTKVLIEGQTPMFLASTEAKDLVELLASADYSRVFSGWKSIEPLYLRASEAEEKLKRGLLKPV